MNLIYSATTIDSNTRAKIQVTEISKSVGGKLRTLSAPAKLVNKRGYLNGGWIYINSALASNKETNAEFKNYSVIDMYSVQDGHYAHSVKVPNFSAKRISDSSYRRKVRQLCNDLGVEFPSVTSVN